MKGLQTIQYAGGEQSLYHVPALRVVSATFELEDTTEGLTSANRVLASGSAVVDTYSTTLGADAGPNTTAPRRLSIDGPAPVVGRVYAIEDAAGQTELHEVEAATDTEVWLTAPVRGSYTAGSTLRGARLIATVPAQVATREELLEEVRNLRLAWSYTIGDRTLRVSELVRVVRETAEDRYLAAAAHVLRDEWAELVNELEPRAGALRAHIAGAARRLGVLLRARVGEPEQLLAGPTGLELLVQRSVVRFAEKGLFPAAGDPDRWAEDMRTEFNNLWRSLVTGTPGHDVVEVHRTDDTSPPGPSRKTRNLIKPR